MSLFRDPPASIYYGENRTAVSLDPYQMGVAVAAGILGIAWFAIWPTCRRKRTTLVVNAGYIFAVYVLVIAVLALVSKSWQLGTVRTSAPYSPYSAREVNSTVGLWLGLTSFNVTMVGEPQWLQPLEVAHTNEDEAAQTGDLHANSIEQIDYNEEVSFGVRQGRFGINEYAPMVNREHRRMQLRGLPYPLSHIIDLFTLDGDGARWGRFSRQAGYYAHILVWLSLPCWVITLMALAIGLWATPARVVEGLEERIQALNPRFMLSSQLRPATLWCMATGLCLIGAPAFYALTIAGLESPVRVHFIGGELRLHYGWTFWLTLATGLVVFAMGAAGFVWTERARWAVSGRPISEAIQFIWGDSAPMKQQSLPLVATKQSPHAATRHSNALATHKPGKSLNTDAGPTWVAVPHAAAGNHASINGAATGHKAASPPLYTPSVESPQQVGLLSVAQPAQLSSIELQPHSSVPSEVAASAPAAPLLPTFISLAPVHPRTPLALACPASTMRTLRSTRKQTLASRIRFSHYSSVDI